MKISRKYAETVIFVALYLTAIYLWTQPIQDNTMPYGEFDAISHIQVADYMSQSDKSLLYLPPYIDLRYWIDNAYRPHTLWYHPPFHTNFAVMQVLGAERIVPIYLTNAIFSTAIIISVYFVMRRLFGFLPAVLSALLIIFSPRDFMPFLWGQWPERLAYAFIPLILYCCYMYYIAYSDNKDKPIYIYLTALFLAINMLIHPLVFFHSIFGLVVLAIFLAIKEKKFPFNIKHISISVMIIIVMLAISPLQTGNVIIKFSKESSEQTDSDFSRIFKWSFEPERFEGSVPASYFSFKEMHGLWTMPFIVLGILFLAFRRERKDIFLLAWVVSLYLVLHRDFFGSMIFLHRSLSASAHIFAPLTVIGMLSLSSIVKLPRNYNTYIKYALAIVFIFLAISINGKSAYPVLKNAYGGLSRLNSAQFEVCAWLMEHTELDENATIIAPLIFKRSRWMAAISQRPFSYFPAISLDDDLFVEHLTKDYFIVDYSDFILLNNENAIAQLQTFESSVLANYTRLYNKNNIRVYKK
jgi:type III secretory pathway component EscS